MDFQIANTYFVVVIKVFEYIKYRWKSKGRHGTHSPFVYDFVDKCIPSTLDLQTKERLKHFIGRLEKSTKSIDVIDLGAGSKRMGTHRKIRTIAKNSSSKGKYGVLLAKMARHYDCKQILELGTSLGIGTAHLALGQPQATVITVEGCPNTAEIARRQFAALELQNIQLINSDFQSFIEKDNRVYDLIYLDGHHIGSAVLSYIKQLEKNMHDETILIIDDIYWSADMKAAWDEIIANENFHCTMDLWRMGIALKRPHQMKEHFYIRY